MNGDAFSLDELSTAPDDQARTLRLMVSSSRKVRVAEIVREIEARQADGEKRPTRVPSAFLTKRASGPADIWTAPHRVVVIAGGRPGAGATTLARSLAAEVSSRGVRAEYVASGVAPAVKPGGADYYLVDSDGSADFDGLADYLVLVAAPDAEAVTGAYAALKRFRVSDPDLPAGLVVNRAASPGEGAALAERIASAARSLLGGPGLEVLGWVLDDDEVRSDSRDAAPFIVRSPRSAAAAGVRLCVRRLSSRWRRPSRAVGTPPPGGQALVIPARGGRPGDAAVNSGHRPEPAVTPEEGRRKARSVGTTRCPDTTLRSSSLHSTSDAAAA